MNQLTRLENESRDSIVTVLADLAIRKISAYTWYYKSEKKQALRALAAGVAFLDSAVLASLASDENADIRQEYIRIKNYVINSCSEHKEVSKNVDSLSHIAFYIDKSDMGKKSKSESLVEYW